MGDAECYIVIDTLFNIFMTPNKKICGLISQSNIKSLFYDHSNNEIYVLNRNGFSDKLEGRDPTQMTITKTNEQDTKWNWKMICGMPVFIGEWSLNGIRDILNSLKWFCINNYPSSGNGSGTCNISSVFACFM